MAEFHFDLPAQLKCELIKIVDSIAYRHALTEVSKICQLPSCESEWYQSILMQPSDKDDIGALDILFGGNFSKAFLRSGNNFHTLIDVWFVTNWQWIRDNISVCESNTYGSQTVTISGYKYRITHDSISQKLLALVDCGTTAWGAYDNS